MATMDYLNQLLNDINCKLTFLQDIAELNPTILDLLDPDLLNQLKFFGVEL